MAGRLVLGTDAGGLRHFVDGQPVHAGYVLEVELEDGTWVQMRYEWNFTRDAPPVFYLALAGPAVAKVTLPESARLRWPVGS